MSSSRGPLLNQEVLPMNSRRGRRILRVHWSCCRPADLCRCSCCRSVHGRWDRFYCSCSSSAGNRSNKCVCINPSLPAKETRGFIEHIEADRTLEHLRNRTGLFEFTILFLHLRLGINLDSFLSLLHLVDYY